MTSFSYQLYSSRNFAPLAGTLAMLAAHGYASVEGYGGVYGDPAGLAAMLRANRLTMPTGHFGLSDLEDDLAGCLATARTLGLKFIYCPYLLPADRPTTAAGWQALGARLQTAGAPLIAAGYRFGWHNHDFEFAPLPDGTLPQDHIFAGGPGLEWEIDIAWIVRGGGDPLAAIARHGPRISAVHLKDIAPAGQNAAEDGWCDVGSGTVDWPAIMAALRQTACANFIMEHDNPADHSRFAGRSLLAAKGF